MSPPLERTLGFGATFTIGAGTMLGAGIFVFPGVAGARTGAGAAISFAIGGAIALLVALVASELATAMPRSGGVVNFAERAFGRTTAGLLGLAQWAGLVFATSFYLMGFGEYAAELLRSVGMEARGSTPVVAALIAGVFVAVVALFDTRVAGALQKYLVIALLIALVGFAVWTLAVPLSGAGPSRELSLAPRGVGPIFSTAALLFTSYLGFVQIANVAGDVERPARTLPRAMIGSVVAVSAMYVAIMLATTLALSPAELAPLGKTALARVAEVRIGAVGRQLVLGAGLLATLSSANASILATSRTVLSLGQRRALPAPVCRVSNRFGTPQVAIAAAAVPALALLGLGEFVLLAEAASLLHLVIYAAICFAVLRTRRADEPAPFRAPGFPAVPLAGGVACLGLCAFFSIGALVAGAVTAAAAATWWLAYARGRTDDLDAED